jgi:hypothetical protein
MVDTLLLGVALALASQQASAQLFGAKDRPLNVGLIGGVVLDANGQALKNTTVLVHLEQVSVDPSECSLRIYGPNRGMNKNVTTTSNGVFLIAFEWEPEQLGCVLGGPVPRALIGAWVFDEKNEHTRTSKQQPLLLAPNLSAVIKGVSPQATGQLGEHVNERIEEATKDNPVLKAYLRGLSEVMSAEMYCLMGDAGVIVAARP